VNGPLGSIVLALGIAIAGFLIAQGFHASRTDRFVTVKGISEREVVANVAIWPLRVVASNDDLGKAQAELERSVAKIREFLGANGIDAANARVLGFAVSDAQTNQYGGGERAGSRFVINQTLVVRSSEPEKVLAASAKVGELVAAGVVLSSGGEYGGGGPTFLFTGLSDLKPAMIAEATARAREAAEQFARDSGSAIGGIRRANQGMFEILPRDRAPGISEEAQLEKTVRVVSTVDYRLE
jgi:hypothetical protein